MRRHQKEDNKQKVISTDKAPSAIGPYSQAIEINGMVYTSGVIQVITATGEIAEGGVEAQAEQAFKNLCNLVEESGSKVENIVQTTVFIKEMIDFDTFAKLDYRALKILSCEAVPKSKKLLKFTLNDGECKNRVILSGIHEYYEPEELVGKTCVAITNLPP